MELYGKAGAFRPKILWSRISCLVQFGLATEAHIPVRLSYCPLHYDEVGFRFVPNDYKVEDYAA